MNSKSCARMRQLRKMRKSAGLSQEQLAEKLTMKRGTFAAFEQGRNDPPTEFWIMVADFFGVSIDWLLGRTDKKEVTEAEQ